MKTLEKASLLRVAFPRSATAQQPPQNDATGATTTTQQPTSKPASILDLARNKLRNNHATSSPKAAQQPPQKTEVVVAQENEEIDEAQEARRVKVLALLQSSPETQRAVIADQDSDPDHVILTIGIRSVATFELMIDKTRFDPFTLLDLIDKQSISTH
jgi:hypothetical protein